MIPMCTASTAAGLPARRKHCCTCRLPSTELCPAKHQCNVAGSHCCSAARPRVHRRACLQVVSALSMCGPPPQVLELLRGWQGSQLDSSFHALSLARSPASFRSSSGGQNAASLSPHSWSAVLDPCRYGAQGGLREASTPNRPVIDSRPARLCGAHVQLVTRCRCAQTTGRRLSGRTAAVQSINTVSEPAQPALLRAGRPTCSTPKRCF